MFSGLGPSCLLHVLKILLLFYVYTASAKNFGEQCCVLLVHFRAMLTIICGPNHILTYLQWLPYATF